MAPGRHAVAADAVFDGAELRRDAAVVIQGTDIAAVVPRRELPAGLAVRQMPEGAWLAPGFIDLQVNGGGDVLFNDAPTPEGIAAIAAAHRRFGTTSLLPTLITDTPDKMRAAFGAVQEMAGTHPGILGIHFEGPFLSPERPGVHDPALIRLPDGADMALLTGPRRGVMLVTLAPERMPSGFIARLTSSGVRVALGHSNVTYEESKAAFAEGLTGVTHLFNAMPPLASRAPGPIAATLETPGVWFGMIADGEHVAPAMLRLALRGAATPMLVTDAMPPVGGSGGPFRLGGAEIAVTGGRLSRADGVLAGSALDMASAVRNTVRLLGLPLAEALRLAAATPAAFLGIDDRLGHLRSGYRADIVALDPERVEVIASWVAGSAAFAVELGPP